MALKKIRLELARDEEFPAGSRDRGYEFIAPLDKHDKIDVSAWRAERGKCRVVRFWGSDEHEHGYLLRTTSGRWAFHYEKAGDIDVDDETGYRFGDHAFQAGEYVSIHEDDGTLRTFRVTRVSDISA